MTRVCLITGGTQGIGRETAELLVSQGWAVIVSGRNIAKGEEVVQAIKSKGGEATFIEADVSDQEAVRALHKKALSIHGRLDGAVNNAGITTDTRMIGDASTEEFEKMWRVNVLGVFWCMQEQIQIMKVQKSGHIVNLASIAGLHGILYSGTYVATKHAVVGMTRTAALEYAQSGIQVAAVAPGAIKTDILNDAIAAGAYSEESIAGMFPMKKMGKPLDIAQAISFLLHSDYATGSILEVDGGLGAA
ncbi:3-oxoacyl-reductase [Plenodomus tracheiphilus IPT5]|uniref:3-oxoacyl-reductase n=1 Tax=Plenodomus tracheiphilus IPT5 TaxID=1408161 RepID=A0A6A7BB29_9PLEO|nr:3-oxoacyl-reductase [Plenodomus tracheiphilus IPT5]